MFKKFTFFDRRKPLLIEKMPTIPLTELYNGLVTVPGMKPRKFSSSCQAGHITLFISKQSQFFMKDLLLAWKTYFVSILKMKI